MMQVKLQNLWLSTSTLLITGLVSCGSLASMGIGVSNISDVHQQRTIDSTVHVQGKVGDRVPLLVGQVYQLEDATGTIWVLTQALAPDQGTQVVLEGKVRYEDIPMNAQNFGEVYLMEEKRLKPEPAQPVSQ